jgi:transcriptional regulator with XRE-family HTH domain
LREHRSVPSVAEVFAENMRRERHGIGVSQERCAIRARLHRTEINLLERAHRIPRIDTLLRIPGALEAEPANLA